ncbi:MAG: isoleucine--tRNA ligase [Planctomycetota bacterium]
MKPYPDVAPQPSFPELEESVLARWQAENTFQRSIDNRPAGEEGSNEYVFYDGPPFANGLPHYGHLLTGFVKDIVPRYQTMRGRRVERRFGWDCHGLPAEQEAEKVLGVRGGKEIATFGVAEFNDACRQAVLKYTREWERYVTRQARWVDFTRDYKTMDLSYMESVMWAFKRLWDKGLVYEGHRVMPYSWALETPLSNFETRMDNAYRPRQDPAITVGLDLVPQAGDPGPMRLLVWTTTPWTLPSNLAAAVGVDIEYALVEKDGRYLVLGAATLDKYAKELGDAERKGTLQGKDLVGRSYAPLFPYFAGHPHAFRIVAGDFVDTAEGTGVVHMAPGFGEDDQRVCEQNDIALVCPVDEKGCYTAEVSDYVGQHVFDANKAIIKRLKDEGRLLRHETYVHNYPHCYRTDTPLIYKAVSSWYVRVSDFKDRMVGLNQEIHWIPEHVKDGQFGTWLMNARDWSISRNRFWGSPIPIWRSDDPNHPRVDVYGSLDEFERDFGVRPTDLHRPFIDQLTRKNPDDPTGKSTMRRVPEVLDCWFESGSMPFAQIHYPFENKEWFEHHFPADFIVEYVAQTRGWFYTMMVLGTALFDKPPFRHCMCHGVVLDNEGQKLSKRLRNYPDPDEVCNTWGADALRWFMVSSPILKGQDLQIDKEGKKIGEVVRQVVNPIWNAYYFFTLYANTDGVRAELVEHFEQLSSAASGTRQDPRSIEDLAYDLGGRARALLDRYILAKTRQLVEQVTAQMDAYDLSAACSTVTRFLDALNNWYIRRSRERFWSNVSEQHPARAGDLGLSEGPERVKQDAYDTLYTVLRTLALVGAPLLPMLCEEVFRGLTGEESVHLADWPDAAALPADPELVARMDRVREVCSTGLSLRESQKLRIRLPLASLTLAGRGVDELRPYADLIADELNVKAVRFSQQLEDYGTFQLQVNAKTLGPKLGPDMKAVLQATQTGDWTLSEGGRARVGPRELEPGEWELRLRPKHGVVSAALPSNDAVVVLDVELTPALRAEGMARDLVRIVQQARKDAGLHVADHIRLHVECSDEVRASLEPHVGYITAQTLADEVRFAPPAAGMHRAEGKVESSSVVVAVVAVAK